MPLTTVDYSETSFLKNVSLLDWSYFAHLLSFFTLHSTLINAEISHEIPRGHLPIYTWSKAELPSCSVVQIPSIHMCLFTFKLKVNKIKVSLFPQPHFKGSIATSD